jgi:hypothetical protein
MADQPQYNESEHQPDRASIRTFARVGLSAGCVLFASIIISLIVATIVGLMQGHAEQYKNWLGTFLEFTLATLMYAFPSWLLSLPFVIALKNAEGRRGWVILLVGISIGPGFVLFYFLIGHGGPLDWRTVGPFLIYASVVSFFATLIYLCTLKIDYRRRNQPQADTEPADNLQ